MSIYFSRYLKHHHGCPEQNFGGTQVWRSQSATYISDSCSRRAGHLSRIFIQVSCLHVPTGQMFPQVNLCCKGLPVKASVHISGVATVSKLTPKELWCAWHDVNSKGGPVGPLRQSSF